MRSLEEHLSPQELVSLPESREILASGSREQKELLQHLEGCEFCGDLARDRWALIELGESRVASEEACPETDVWLQYAAGLRQQDSMQLLRHLATCSRCAADLREAMEFMQPAEINVNPAATDSSTELASETAEWQRAMAVRMVEAASTGSSAGRRGSGVSRQRRWPKLFAWIAVPLTAAIAITASIGVWRLVRPSDSRLLALAYNKQRTLVLRIPGALPVPMASGTRGNSSGLREPEELLELRLRAQRALDQAPNSPYWHQILGEIDLLDGDGESARRDLEFAQTTDDKLPNLKNDLAAAWFEMGEKTGNTEDYAQAAELYSQQIHDHSADPSLLYFNRAICWERQNLTRQAVDDLRTALSTERSPAWRKAIQAELSRLSTHSDLTTDDYELALKQVIENLLPHWSNSPNVRAIIVRVAQSGQLHHDRWLLDWIDSPHTSDAAIADQHLASAISAGDEGGAQFSFDDSISSADLYRHAGNKQGLLRAQLAEVYAMQRLGRSRDCLRLAGQIERQIHLGEYSYPVVTGQTLLQDSICRLRMGDFAGARAVLAKALSIAGTAGLTELRINAISMQASLLSAEGMYGAAWQTDALGLGVCLQVQCTPSHEYKLVYHAVGDAEQLGLRLTAVQLMHYAVSLAADSRDVITHAYALETLALVEGRTGDFDLAARAFAEAHRVGYSGNPNAMADLYQAEWLVDEAEIWSRAGRSQKALVALRKSAPAILASDYQPGRVSYYNQLSIAELALGDSADALDSSIAAAREAERSLASLHSMAERQQWIRENAPTYWQLIDVYLRRGEQTAALCAWERFRSAAYASATPFASPERESLLSDKRVIVVARVGDSYIGWLATTKPLKALQTVVLGDRTHLELAANIFYRLCANRDSRIADVSDIGSRLYFAFLQPFARQLVPSLWIELDPSLSMLPLSALKTPDGRWLGELTRITVLPPWWSLDPSSALQEQAINNTMRFAAVTSFAPGTGEDPEVYPIAKLFTAAVVLDGRSSSTKGVLNAISAAQVFHFSGHATSTSGARLILSSAATGTSESLSPDSLSKVRLLRCRLAVLAACDTTASDPDQIETLPDMRNALLVSGAHAVVASNWDVDDSSTNKLMLSFYHQLLGGAAAAEALRIAEQTVRSSPAWQHPFYWAAFEVFTR